MFNHFWHHFIPHAENDHTPHLLKERTIAFLLLVVVGVFALTAVQSQLVKHNAGMMAAVLPSALTDIVNENREEGGLGALERSEKLSKAAQLKAQHMAENGYFAHFSPQGVSPWHWMNTAGYDYVYAGENLAMDFADSADVVRAWMDSRLHRENILEPKFTQVGFGTARGTYQGKETTFVVQMLAKPMDSVESDTSSVASNADNNRQAVAGVQREAGVDAQEQTAVNTKQSTSTASPRQETTNQSEAGFATAKNPSNKTATSNTRRAGDPRANASPTPVGSVDDVPDSRQVSGFAGLITQPTAVIEGMYAILTTLIALALAGIVIEYRRHHIRHMFYGLSLVVVMALFVYLSHTLLLPVPIVG